MRGLYVITDGSTGAALLYKAERALQGGAALLQYRDKTTDAARRWQEAAALRQLCRQHGATFIVNDDVALAQAVQADGVHLGRDDMTVQQARALLGKAAIIGVSCYNQLDLARTAQQQGADYIALGSFFPSPTKPQAVHADLTLLRQAQQQLGLPICAIGGITLATAPLLVEHGATMLAVISDVFNAEDIAAQARRYAVLWP